MMMFIYFFFRILLLFLLNIDSDIAFSQEPVRPADSTAIDSSLFNREAEIGVVLDSTLNAVEELKAIPKSSEQIIKKSKKLSRKLDHIYYNSILPIKFTESRPFIPMAVIIKSPPIVILNAEYRCLEMRVVVPPPAPRQPWIKRINPFRKRN